MSAFTPGPWVVRRYVRTTSETVIYPAGETWGIFQQGHDGSSEYDTILFSVASEIQDESIAKVIASIPDLLAEKELTEKTWFLQQREIENLRLSLSVRTAQRNEAESKLEHLIDAFKAAGVTP